MYWKKIDNHQNSLPLMIKWMPTFLPLWKRQISYYHLFLCLFVVKSETCFTFLCHLLNVVIYTWLIHCFFSYICPWPDVPLGYAVICLSAWIVGYLWPVFPHKQSIIHAQMSTCRREPRADSFWPSILGNIVHILSWIILCNTLCSRGSFTVS